jgi:2,3-bisphosphoglycerate-independent phosphoglycerate mutase
MKYVIVILDGAAGWPLEQLGGRTTLAAAHTPNLDALVRRGRLGCAQTIPDGVEPSSAAACTSILGYDPVADYVGRGAIEAASMGIVLEPGQVALRLNLVNIEDGIMKSYSCGGISTEESGAIVADLASSMDDETFRLHPGVAYRHILVVSGHPELLDVSYTPPHDITGRSVAPYVPNGKGSQLLLDYMKRAGPLLENSGINQCRIAEGGIGATDVWPFWPGAKPAGLQAFSQKRSLSAAMSSGVDLLNGLAVLTGMDRLSIAGVTGGPDNDYEAQAAGSLAALEDHDLVVVHVESPDEEGHEGNVEGKIEAIEAIDRHVVSRVRERANAEGIRILAMPDHPTPIEIKTHVAEAVPFVLWGPGIQGNGASSYDEDSAAATGVRLDPGRLVMDEFLD